MSNVQIAIDFATQSISRTNPGGIVAFPMFPGATKHDVRTIQKSLLNNVQVASADVNKKFVIINIKV